MQIQQDFLQDGQHYAVRSYGEGHLRINDDLITESLILTPTEMDRSWPPTSFNELQSEHLDALLERDPEVVLIGTGASTRVPQPWMMGHVMRAGAGLECMDTGAASRTFNVLVAEERRVVAGLFMIEPS